ncbi:hypothetical protein KNP414_02380 [Paenibacillus mucilaginosus KNP414]|uniref:Uncharacterized protein n=1 Tax=Paenibacillus mucilaginosus (strain KNP414) TaxID=1036673 RepID=F8F5D0_PAEMK|nr:hypothetical protein KNP414_02380 [Paenibacillus mucilaginosus KNP414]
MRNLAPEMCCEGWTWKGRRGADRFVLRGSWLWLGSVR